MVLPPPPPINPSTYLSFYGPGTGEGVCTRQRQVQTVMMTYLPTYLPTYPLTSVSTAQALVRVSAQDKDRYRR